MAGLPNDWKFVGSNVYVPWLNSFPLKRPVRENRSISTSPPDSPAGLKWSKSHRQLLARP